MRLKQEEEGLLNCILTAAY
uniref:Uncharacterized protein n=1 Tax=Arundo donax TaxID=35708 RepID=A0A0A8YQG3_ARUDO